MAKKVSGKEKSAYELMQAILAILVDEHDWPSTARLSSSFTLAVAKFAWPGTSNPSAPIGVMKRKELIETLGRAPGCGMVYRLISTEELVGRYSQEVAFDEQKVRQFIDDLIPSLDTLREAVVHEKIGTPLADWETPGEAQDSSQDEPVGVPYRLPQFLPDEDEPTGLSAQEPGEDEEVMQDGADGEVPCESSEPLLEQDEPHGLSPEVARDLFAGLLGSQEGQALIASLVTLQVDAAVSAKIDLIAQRAEELVAQKGEDLARARAEVERLEREALEARRKRDLHVAMREAVLELAKEHKE